MLSTDMINYRNKPYLVPCVLGALAGARVVCSDKANGQTVLKCSEICRKRHLNVLLKSFFYNRETCQLQTAPLFSPKKTDGHRRIYS